MDVGSSSERLSVVCSASADYSSNSSEASSPNSRRSSMNESLIKDEHYWERRKKNNDASKRCREKRRLGDAAMEHQIRLLARENERLKTQLESRTATDSLLATRQPMPEFASLPSQSNTVLQHTANHKMFSSMHMPTSSLSLSGALHNPLSVSLPPPMTAPLPPSLPLLPTSSHIPMLQLCQLQAALQQQSFQYRPVPPPPQPVFSFGSAFTPFQKDSVIMKADRTSPDSSSDNITNNVIRRAPSPSERPQSLLSALLSARRTSPIVPQSRTEHSSGLASPPRTSSSKSDCESISSSASLSPSHSLSEDLLESSAIRHALNGGDGKTVQYMDRRKRNNEAAKRCRANRRAVFEYRSRKVQLLEGENDQLKADIARLRKELEQQKAMLASVTPMDTSR